MRLQFIQSHFRQNRLRVADHVEIILAEIDDAGSRLVGNKGVANVPFLRNHPVQHLRARRHLANFHPRQQFLQIPERLPDAVPGDATANRKQVACPSIHLVADVYIWVEIIHRECIDVRLLAANSFRDQGNRIFIQHLPCRFKNIVRRHGHDARSPNIGRSQLSLIRKPFL